MTLSGGLMVCGTASNAGKTTVVAGLCRLLARKGVRVAPFKAQNMALNSAVTRDGAEIGRAQAAQAHAAGVEPEAAMNPILLKPATDRASQVIVMGRPWANLDAAQYQRAKPALWDTVLRQLVELRSRFDVVICEGAGSPAEINLLDDDLVNLRLARAAQIPAVVVGDIDRGGVFASLYGTVALLPEDLRRTVGGFLINKFRGDVSLLGHAPTELERRTGVPTLGVLPWLDGVDLDAEDSLASRNRPQWGGASGDSIDVAVVAFPRISNFTDLDALALEPGVSIRLVNHRDALGSPDLLVLPGTKSTIQDLTWMRQTGLAVAIAELASATRGGGGRATTVLGVCGGYQMLGHKVDDSSAVEYGEPRIEAGLGLLPVTTVFEEAKTTSRCRGVASGHPVEGYEIHHGRTLPIPQGGDDGASAPTGAWILLDDGGAGQRWEGSSARSRQILGTSVHGLLESDGFRAAFLAEVAERSGKRWIASGVSFAAARQERYDRIADALEAHADVDALERLISGSGNST